MTNSNDDKDRDDVLYEFHQAYERPTPGQIAEWTERYPQFADDIRAHAAISWDWKAREEMPVPAADQAMLDQGFSQVLDAIYNAKPQAETPASCQSFQQLMDETGTSVPKLAREWDLPRSVLADLCNGVMRAPVGPRLLGKFRDKFGLVDERFNQLHETALASPRLGHAKASKAPVVNTRSYAEIIRDTSMTPEQKAYWLSEESTRG